VFFSRASAKTSEEKATVSIERIRDVGRKERRVRASERWFDKVTGKRVTFFDAESVEDVRERKVRVHRVQVLGHRGSGKVLSFVERCNRFARKFIDPTFARTYARFFPSDVFL